MSSSDDIWILGIHMTKFGKHPDKDTVDLAAEAVHGALADAGVTMGDIGVLAAGNLMDAGGLRAAAAEAGRPDRHPRVQRLQRLRHRGHRAAHGDHGRQGRRGRLRHGRRRREAGRRRPAGGGGQAKSDGEEWTPKGRYGAVAPIDGRIGTETMPGVFAQIGMEYGHRYGGVDFELFAKISEKNHAHSTLNPLAAYQKRFTLDEIMNDMMIAYPNTRPMCSANCDGAAAAVVVNGETLKTLSLEQQRRAVKVSASVLTTDPWEEACQVLPNVNTLTRNAATAGLRAGRRRPRRPRPRRAARLLRHRRARPLRQPQLCEEGGAADFFNSGAPWRDGTTPVNVSGGLQSKGHPISATGIANIWEVCHHLRGEAGDRQIEGAKVGLAHVIGLGSACGVHILEKSAA